MECLVLEKHLDGEVVSLLNSKGGVPLLETLDFVLFLHVSSGHLPKLLDDHVESEIQGVV